MPVFTVMPMAQEINLKPGETYRGSIKVAVPQNAEESFRYKVQIMPYSVVGQDYTADLITQSDYTLMSKWMIAENPTGEVQPNETATVEFEIKVPESAPAGGQYATLLVGLDDGQLANTAGVKNVYQMASVIYADVAGETAHAGEVLENSVPGFATTGKLVVSATVNNTGNVHEKAISSIKVENAWSHELIFPVGDAVGAYTEVIMPESTRYFSREIRDLPMLGVFEVTQNITYLGEQSNLTKTVVMCPLWFLILVGATCFVAILTLARVIKKRKNRENIA